MQGMVLAGDPFGLDPLRDIPGEEAAVLMPSMTHDDLNDEAAMRLLEYLREQESPYTPGFELGQAGGGCCAPYKGQRPRNPPLLGKRQSEGFCDAIVTEPFRALPDLEENR